MHVVLLGGAPGIGKSTVTRSLLQIASSGTRLIQCVDVDALWLHQPWRVDSRMKDMVQGNLRAVIGNAARAGVDLLVITWVFQGPEIHQIVKNLLPPDVTSESIQLHATQSVWRHRFEQDPGRPHLDAFYLERYFATQTTPADHVIDTDGLEPDAVARALATIVGVTFA